MRNVVLLHGFTGSAASFDRLCSGLDGVEVHRPALLGHGAGAPAATSFVDEVDRLAEEMPAEPAVLVGYSMGGRLALGLLARHTRRFRAAVLVGAHPGLTHGPDRLERRQRDATWIDCLRREGIEAFVEAWEALPLFQSTQGRLSGAEKKRQRRIRLSHRPEGLIASLAICGLAEMPDWWESLSTIEVPTVWVAGAEDTKFSALARSGAELMPNGRVAIAEGAGHNVILERPEVVARWVVEAERRAGALA